MKRYNFISISILLIATLSQSVISQEIEHDYIIIGKTRSTVSSKFPGEKSVEYDPKSSDHLFINEFINEGQLTSKTRYLFTRKRFELAQLINYIINNDIRKDGLRNVFRVDGSIEIEQLFKNDELQKETTFYSNGNNYLSYNLENKLVNGEYKIWHENGQLKYTGSFQNGLKNGEFNEFDKSGKMTRAGIYQDGKLISGEKIVPDILYDKPEKSAIYIYGDEAFDEYLKIRSEGIEKLSTYTKFTKCSLKLLIDNTGKVTNMESLSDITPDELGILSQIFKVLPVFTPATVEDIPVLSSLRLDLLLSSEGLKRNSELHVIIRPMDMPSFPGGVEMLKKYLATTVRYPVESQKKRIEGKVLVTFVVDEEGDITNVKVSRPVDFYLDAEAVRVVKSMPKWNPGKQDGRAIKVSFTIPINFQL